MGSVMYLELEFSQPSGAMKTVKLMAAYRTNGSLFLRSNNMWVIWTGEFVYRLG
jgi:hypothetical protein